MFLPHETFAGPILGHLVPALLTSIFAVGTFLDMLHPPPGDQSLNISTYEDQRPVHDVQRIQNS